MRVEPVRIGACLIVRDEAARITTCCASLEDLVDEVVVVDTGSGDDTVALARAAGATVLEIPWVDDFAAARNVALDGSTAPFVLSIDADEQARGDATGLLEVLEASDPAVDAWSVVIEESVGADVRGLSAHREAKVLRREASRWAGRVHERLVLRDGSAPTVGPLASETLCLVHDGYRDAEQVRAKAARNLGLCELELADRRAAGAAPGELARVLLDLGRSATGCGRREKATSAFASVRSLVASGPAFRWATGFLAEDALARGDGAGCLQLVAELDADGAPRAATSMLEARARIQRGDRRGARALLEAIGAPVDLSDRALGEAPLRALLAELDAPS